MTRITIIDGHPDPAEGRFIHSLADAYESGARAAGHHIRRISIARLVFPLVRTQSEWEHGVVPPDIEQAQAAITEAEHLVILYPLWLGDMPALLKAFLEQVARPTFAFRYREKGLSREVVARSLCADNRDDGHASDPLPARLQVAQLEEPGKEHFRLYGSQADPTLHHRQHRSSTSAGSVAEAGGSPWKATRLANRIRCSTDEAASMELIREEPQVRFPPPSHSKSIFREQAYRWSSDKPPPPERRWSRFLPRARSVAIRISAKSAIVEDRSISGCSPVTALHPRGWHEPR